MRNRIEELNLMFGVSTTLIMSKYKEFKTKSIKNVDKLATDINNLFTWLEQQENINSINVVIIGELLFEDHAIRNAILNDDVVLKEVVKNKLEQLDYEDIESSIKYDDSLMFSNYGVDDNVPINTDPIDYMTNMLYLEKYMYKDIMKQLLDNFDFGRNMKSNNYKNHCVYFLNILNKICYELDLIIQGTREDLYYGAIWFLSYRYGKILLFPSVFHLLGYERNKEHEIIRAVKNSLFNCLININKFYYIEVSDFGYANNRKYCSRMDKEVDYEFCNLIYNLLDTKATIYLLKIASYDKDYSYTDNDIKEIDYLVSRLKNCDKVKVSSQTTNDTYKDLIEKSVSFAKKYCDDNNLKVNNFVFNPDFDVNPSIVFLEFNITYNNFDYKFKLRKTNNKFSWNVFLKNGKNYKINLYLEDDFKHLIQAMINE